MTDDLKHRFEQLVADPPPPSGVPSEAVFARVRSVRRRRTAGVVTLAAAAVVAVAVAAGNLTDVDSSPPVSNTPSAPVTVVTGPPTATPTTTPTLAPPSSAGTPPANTPAPPPIGVGVVLEPTVKGRTVTMRITVSGTAVRPTTSAGRALPANTSFLNLSFGTNYTWGDGKDAGGSDAGAVTCEFSKKRTTGRETYSVPSHTYAEPGTYTFHYTVRYCGTDGSFETSKTTQVVIR